MVEVERENAISALDMPRQPPPPSSSWIKEIGTVGEAMGSVCAHFAQHERPDISTAVKTEVEVSQANTDEDEGNGVAESSQLVLGSLLEDSAVDGMEVVDEDDDVPVIQGCTITPEELDEDPSL